MQSIRSISPVLRAIGIIGAVAVLVTSVTFAALNDEATLATNDITSDTADLRVSNGGTFGDSRTGFNATDLVPGEGETFDFYLQNASDFDMDVQVYVTGSCGDYVSGTDGIGDCNDVLLTFTDTNSSTDMTWTLQQLINGAKDVPGNALTANSAGTAPADGDEGDFQVTFDLDPNGLSGSTASMSAPFDLVFTGTQAL